jgi:hypothetical protein
MQDLTRSSGNTLPPLLSSFIRTVAIVLAVGCVVLEMTLNVLFLQREYRRKLAFPAAALRVPG